MNRFHATLIGTVVMACALTTAVNAQGHGVFITNDCESPATRGLPLRPGVDLEVEDEGADFADAVLRLLAQPGVARAMADEGRRHLGELLDVRTNLNRIAELLSPRRPASRRRPTGSPT